MHGWSVDELLGRPSAILGARVAPEQDAAPPSGLWERRRNNVTREGRVFPALLRSDLVYSEEGALLGTVTTTEDLSRLLHLNQLLEEREQMLDLLAEAAGSLFGAACWRVDIVQVLDRLGGILRARVTLLDVDSGGGQSAAEQWLAAQVVGAGPALVEADPARFRAFGGRLAAETRSWLVRGILGAGRLVMLLSAESEVAGRSWDEAGCRALQMTAQLVAALMRRDAHELELAKSSERYRQLVEQSQEMIQSVDASGRFVFVNRAWRECLGIEESDLRSLTVWDVVAPDHHSDCLGVLSRLSAGETSVEVSLGFRARSGRIVPVEGVVGAQHEGGRFVATLGFFRDVSVRLEAERLKDDLIASVSHELRTPLASLLAALDLVRRGRLEAQGATPERLLDIAERNARRLDRMVSGLLELQRVKAGRVAYRREPVSTIGWLSASMRSAEEAAARRGVELAPAFGQDDVIVLTDPQHSGHMVGLVLAHAVRTARPGDTISISATRSATELSIAIGSPVIEKGIGERSVPFRLEAPSEDGSGLELAIAAEIAARLSARFVESCDHAGRPSVVISFPRVVEATR